LPVTYRDFQAGVLFVVQDTWERGLKVAADAIRSRWVGFPQPACGEFQQRFPEVLVVNGEDAQIGVKFTVTSPVAGAGGATWDITSAWGVDWNGPVRLVTAAP
jgi:hypothetical protein